MAKTLLVLAALAAVLVPRTVAQPARISVQVVVTDADDRILGGLTQDDFEVVSDGRTRAIESFAAGPSPATICLLFDVSASMDGTVGKGSAPAGLETAMDAWVDARPASADRWQVSTVSRHVLVGTTFVSDGPALRDAARAALAVPDAQRFGPSPIWDAVDAGIGALETESGKRAVLLVTDGRSTGNRLGVRDAIRHALAAGVAVTVISEARDDALPLGDRRVLLVRPELALQLIAEQTGGSYVRGLTVRAVSVTSTAASGAPLPAGSLDRVLEELHQSYVVGFSGAVADGQLHRLEVTVKRPGARVQTRKAYIVDVGR
jgi:VWFA-related protein